MDILNAIWVYRAEVRESVRDHFDHSGISEWTRRNFNKLRNNYARAPLSGKVARPC